MMFTKADSLRGLKRKAPLKEGQHAREFIRAKGKIGQAWGPVRAKFLKGLFNKALGTGVRPRVDDAGWECVYVDRVCMQGEAVIGQIKRRTGAGGRMLYRTPGSEVGHKMGFNQSRRPDLRHDESVLELQSFRYNRFYEPTHRTKSVNEEEA